MRIVGLTGGSGAGKTEVLRVFQTLGAVCLDADRIYHELLSRDDALLRALRARFPSCFVEGALSRKLLGNLVFHDPGALADLNRIAHAAVLRQVRAELREARARGARVAVLDAPQLFESGFDRECSAIVGVLAPWELRVRRIRARDGVTEEQAVSRLNAQKSDEFFRTHCDYIVNNEGSLSRLREQAERIFRELEESSLAKKADKERRSKVLLEKKNGFDCVDQRELERSDRFCEGYKEFLDEGKTERDAVSTIVNLVEQHDFRRYTPGMDLRAGDRIYYVNHAKSIFLAVMGETPLREGVHLVASHVDSPRLDLKPNPLYEKSELAFFKTHYYGGIKKYQWPTIPLELRGVVCLTDGTDIKVSIGADPADPVLCITDLLPHLATEQYKKTLHTAIPGETLNVLLGSRPAQGTEEEKDRVKLAVMELLHEKYGITEADFQSAELCLVPAGPARDVGLDRSMIGAYGHDDRVCAYTSLQAMLSVKHPRRTAVCILADKEEIGSEGVSGMQSDAFDYFMECLCDSQDTKLRACYANSLCLSADVTAAYDPTFENVSDPLNSPYLNYGIGICKYTGSRGKSGASDASAEVLARVRGLFDREGVLYQMATLGKVDQGGGGTVAMYLANRNIETLDAGVAVLSMHAPFEIVSKLDVYMTYKAFKAFFQEK